MVGKMADVIQFITISSPYRKKDKNTIERIHRRAIKMISELRDHSYEEHIIDCGLTTVVTRRLGGDKFKFLRY